MKPHRGGFTDWTKQQREPTEEHLGFFLTGRFQGHPTFGNHRGRTSMVVKWCPAEGWFETLNSRYDLGEEFKV